MESLIDEITGSFAEDDTQVSKFHGIYQQTDLSLTSERKKQKLEPYYMFMVRVRVPGGISSANQWIEMDRLADQYGNNTLKITTRQAYQFHGILKRDLKKHIRKINEALLDTVAACGDVNRNVMCSPNPNQARSHTEVDALARQVSQFLTPSTRAYHEIWLEDKLIAGGPPHLREEPIYGKLYLPRKFKIAFALPPFNDTDIFTNDVGLIAIEERGVLTGFNVAIGGGMGNTFGDIDTYPKLGEILGFCTPEQVVAVIENVVKIQRDFGNRENRKIARLKYTVDRLGLDWFRKEIESRSGITFEKQRSYEFVHNGDQYGWNEDVNGNWYYTLFVENGRVLDKDKLQMKKCLAEIARLQVSDFRLTGNQNLIFGNVTTKNKQSLQSVLDRYGISNENITALRLNSLACVAMNTCPLAFSEAETYLPKLIDRIDELTNQHGISKEAISIRMTGCPNCCARPYNAEIAFVGRAPGVYNLYLGGNRDGSRLNRLYKEMLKEDDILKELGAIFADFAGNNTKQLGFGDFVWEKAYVNRDIPLTL